MCFPVALKAKYYPWVLIMIFSVLFGPDGACFVGILVGYLYVYGLFRWLEMSTSTATLLERRLPFSLFGETRCKFHFVLFSNLFWQTSRKQARQWEEKSLISEHNLNPTNNNKVLQMLPRPEL